MLILLLLLYRLKLAAPICSTLTITSLSRLKPLNVRANVIEFIINTTITNKLQPFLQLLFQPPLTRGSDYEIDYMVAENSLPYFHNPRRHYHDVTSLISVALLPGRVWIRNISATSDLFVTQAFQCSNSKEALNYQKSARELRIRVASFTSDHPKCPQLPALPDANPAFNTFIKKIFGECSNLRIIKSKRLHQHHMSSISLLSPNMQVLLVDGSDQHNITEAAQEVDRFLGPHSVLDVVWEPYSNDEPRWFILMPYPRGMPGHLFAMIDHVQWHHPSVLVSKNKTLLQPQCNQSYMKADCVMGCPGTFLSRMTASGFGADAWHMLVDTRRALLWHEPMQAAPIRLGNPKIGCPDWQGVHAWTYTYGGCHSNFMDCYFLDHSPCPPISIDPYEVLVDNKTRVRAWNAPHFNNQDERVFKSSDLWWSGVFGNQQQSNQLKIPKQSCGGRDEKPAEQAFYAYMWRPNYYLRKEIYHRLKQFSLHGSCAAMHVRRGDVVGHRSSARTYIRVESYVRAAKPLMDAMQIKTILLFTDSQSAIDEAHNCTRDYPDVCEGIKFRYVEKKRWYGAEGGWENPFPSGSPQQELYSIQQEFALAQKCQIMIMGQSNYGDRIYMHMCCGFPLRERGRLPQRCICPPYVQIDQAGFRTCKEGNLLVCKNNSMSRLNFLQSLNPHDMVRGATVATLNHYAGQLSYNLIDYKINSEVKLKVDSFVREAVNLACADYENGPLKGDFCQ